MNKRSGTDLSAYDNHGFDPGGNSLSRLLWFIVNALVFQSYLFPVYWLKRLLLRLFGSKIGKGVVIKPGVSIKYPWNLSVGDHSWIGEKTWIDNLAAITIGKNCCISQGALLLTGNHDYTKPAFDLITAPITLEDGSWIGARAVVCPGIRCGTHAVLSAGSVASRDLEANGVYAGNPALRVRERVMKEAAN